MTRPLEGPVSPQYLDARPTLEVADIGTALEFWNEVAGFATDALMGEPPVFAIVGAGTVQLGLVEVGSPAVPEGAACYITLQGLDQFLEQVERAGLPLAVPLTIRPWGLRDVVVACPGGGPMVAFGEPMP